MKPRSPALLALAAGSLLSGPANAALQDTAPRFHPKAPVAVPCYAYRDGPISIAGYEERLFRCGAPRVVRTCVPAKVQAWNFLVERCSIREVWGHGASPEQ